MGRVFVAGAAGAIGRQLVPMLVAEGHQVTGTTRSEDKAAWLRGVGAEAAVLDVFEAGALRDAVGQARPDVVIHQLTDLSAGFGPDALRANSRLRQIGTRNVVAAMLAAGTGRLVAQSGAWLYAKGPMPHVESDPLRDPRDFPDDPVLPGILELERLVTQATGFAGIVLRYGFLYGPGTVGAEPGALPSVHVAAAALAAAQAVERGATGVYNVVDDSELVSNRRARLELGWNPATWS